MDQGNNFVVGQRWASHTEADLGLGVVIELEGRRVTLSFPAVEEIRTYTTRDAPLSRIKYAIDETITSIDGQLLTITDLSEHNGLILYHCIDAENRTKDLSELQLSAFVRFCSPQQRLFSGQFGGERSYKLRAKTLQQNLRLHQMDIQGLSGTRTSLLPHQLYIAHEVSKRHAPRVLLADEVGLGKTIEAGMILHQQIISGKSERVLIIVPESLLHQWLVEMLRRFNLAFSIFDRSRLAALSASEVTEQEPLLDEQKATEEKVQLNPFESEQKIICSLDFLMSDSAIRAQLLQAHWDMVIIDEAHHIAWSEDKVNDEYRFVEQLSQQTDGLLLLTATPEQAGIESHFARLHLLDPARFNQLEAFKKEAQEYTQINQLISAILDQDNQKENQLSKSLSKKQLQFLQQQLPHLAAKDIPACVADEKQKQQLIRQLLDQYGTGRVLFRNTRANIKDFPEREVIPQPLSDSENIYAHLSILEQANHDNLDQLLFPEQTIDESLWIKKDPRVNWLTTLLKNNKKQKILVICHRKETAIALDKYLNLSAGIRSTCFYEGLTIVERDRSAAYFSDSESGAQTLICSEIGSEGRNFQFAHHLVLFDLPINPDLVEQRIGRLDRIGQTETIKIHVPYMTNLPQSILFNWYQNALNLFQKSCAAGYLVYQTFQPQLLQQLVKPDDKLEELINSARAFTQTTMSEFKQGRDRLLELNSCNPEIAQRLISSIESLENNHQLSDYMTQVFDYFGIEQEFHSEGCIIVRPGDHMQQEHFPGLKTEGNTLTYQREIALAREDMEFLSWEHPMVTGVMEMLINTELGNSAVSMMQIKGLAPATILLETFYTASTMAPRSLQLHHYLQPEPYRFLFDIKGKDLSETVPHHRLNDLCNPVTKRRAQGIVAQIRKIIEKTLLFSEQKIKQRIPEIKQQALARMQSELQQEKQRLISLQKMNGAIRDDEIEFIDQQIQQSEHYLNQTEAVLQSIRVIVNS